MLPVVCHLENSWSSISLMPLRLADYPAVAILCIGTSSTSLGKDCLSALILLCICYILGLKQKKYLCSVQEVGFHPYKKGFHTTTQ